MNQDVSTAVAWHFGTMGALLILVAAAFAVAWAAFGILLLLIPLVYVLAVIWIADELPPLFWRGYKAALPKRGIYGRVSPVFWLIACRLSSKVRRKSFPFSAATPRLTETP